MRSRFRELVRAAREARPGDRFQAVQRQRVHMGVLERFAFGLLGVVFVVAGVVMLVIPGPGMVAIVLGVALFALESIRLARLLDWSERTLRRLWRTHRVQLVAVAAVVVLAALAGSTWFVERRYDLLG